MHATIACIDHAATARVLHATGCISRILLSVQRPVTVDLGYIAHNHSLISRLLGDVTLIYRGTNPSLHTKHPISALTAAGNDGRRPSD